MICFRCGSDVPDGSPECPNCGQRFTGKRKTFTTTTTTFRALEKRRIRSQKGSGGLPFSVGDVIQSRYEVRDLVGRGPLGVVYRVFDQEIELEVALKVVHPEVLESTGGAGFDEAIRKVRRLSQQNIVRLYEPGAEGDLRFFTMQFLEGLTLRKVMGLRQDKGRRFSAREVEPIFSQITMALGHAHRHVVHGNLTPDNVVILPDVVKLTDFAMDQAVGGPAFVAAQREAGRQRYLAPELLAGEPVDLRADIFSVGAILYELLTGRPFGQNVDPVSVVLAEVGDHSHPGIDLIIGRATAAAPSERFESAEAFAEALSTYIDSREIEGARQRAVADPLLPEDVTRKVRVPAELRLAPAAAAAAGVSASGGVEPPEGAPVEAEQSYVEELSEDDLLMDAGASIDARGGAVGALGAVGAAAAAPSVEMSLSAPPEVDFGAPPPAVDPAYPGEPGPWFLRSNLGFIIAIALIVGVSVMGAMWFLRDNKTTTRPRTVATGDATVGSQTAPISVAAVRARPVTDAAPVTQAAPASVVAATPATAPPSQPAANAASATKAAPATEPPKRPATKAAPASVARVAPATEPPAQPATTAPARADTSDTLKCSPGMLLVKTSKFPRGSIRRGVIKGIEAVAIARSGGAYCVDRYEYPGKGRRPRTSVTFNAAEGLCKAAGRRLCTDREWLRACGGAFPYGRSFNANRCNTEDAEGEERAVTTAGAFRKCRSPSGAYDMSGNVAEWTGSQTVRGGDFASSDEDAGCRSGGRRSAGSARASIGFRCCSDFK